MEVIAAGAMVMVTTAATAAVIVGPIGGAIVWRGGNRVTLGGRCRGDHPARHRAIRRAMSPPPKTLYPTDGVGSHIMEVLAPTRLETLWFAARAWGLRALYLTRNAFRGRPSRLPQVTGPAVGPLLAESTTRLRSGADTVDSRLELGKIQNLRTAARRFHGLRIPAGAEFSFWRQAGPPWRLRGYVEGRELREGCLVPS